MRITLSNEDEAKFALLTAQMNANINAADIYNNILESKRRVHESFTPAIVELHPEAYTKDPYFRNVRPKVFSEKEWELGYDAYLPNEGFVYDEIVVDPSLYFKETTKFGFFNEEFRFLSLKQNGVTWMSVTPHEIATMAMPLGKAHGRVVTLGLGLGYFAYLASLKDEVTQVTIIERDTSAIDIFKQKLLPFFPKKEKIVILTQDAFAFLKKPAGPFDYLFADLWHLPEDGLPLYLRLKPFEANYPKTDFSYWVEESMLSLLRRALLILMNEETQGSNDEDYDFAATDSDLLINALHFALKKKTIVSFEEIMALLNDDNLKEIAKSLSLYKVDR